MLLRHERLRMDQFEFVQSQNIKKYRNLLDTSPDETERQTIQKLLAKERSEAGVVRGVMSKIIAQLLGLFALLVVLPNSAGAQQTDRPPNLNLGDAVVTGFSGTNAPDPT